MLETNYGNYNIILWKKNGVVKHFIMEVLDIDFVKEDFDYIMCLKFDASPLFVAPNIDELIKSLETIFYNGHNTFVVLTQRRSPPEDDVRFDEFIYSFSSSFSQFKRLMHDYNKNEILAKNLLFNLLDRIFNGSSNFDKLLVRQIPIRDDPSFTGSLCDVVIPHRGEIGYLKSVLFFLDQITQIKISIGVDQQPTRDFIKLAANNSTASCYFFYPSPVGPYIVRNHLIKESDNNLIFFQDSDDIPCADRFEKISEFMLKDGCELCGSHELRLDYFDRTVRGVRYPVNVMSALEKNPAHALLHPTSAITREAFYLCNRLSEDRTFGNDTQFLLRSFFILKSIKNVDEFLYIRRRRPDSLTTSYETSLQSPIRGKLLNMWKEDFKLVKNGTLKLENSSLIYKGPKFKLYKERML